MRRPRYSRLASVGTVLRRAESIEATEQVLRKYCSSFPVEANKASFIAAGFRSSRVKSGSLAIAARADGARFTSPSRARRTASG
ncbi:hypothetical protein Lesp01_81740 [Lentzea sp. NBRC 102530]|nr:hypothetical protein Lesp01_81740 [Lentzea sp. NBRC 102530]